MKASNQDYLRRLKERYATSGDQSSITALAEVESMEDRARELKIYREQPKTMELISETLKKYKLCLERLTDQKSAMDMTDAERGYWFALMDWCRFTLDVVGENPDLVEQGVDQIVESYAHKAGLIPSYSTFTNKL